MQSDFDVEACRWCNGDGKDHGTLGMPVVRDCPRCQGSGRVQVTSRESVTGRRRVYKGPAPRQIFAPAKSALPPSLAVAGVTAALQQQQLHESLQKPKRINRRKDARSHVA